MRRFFRFGIITLFITLLTISLISPGQTQETNAPVVIPGRWGDSDSASADLVAVRYQCLACHQSYRVR